jgi:hypothetical protein
MAFLCGAAANLADCRFEEVLKFTEGAEDLEATGSRMISLQLRSYRALAEAFLSDAPQPDDALLIAEQWAAEGFGSMVCNVDSNALLVGALCDPAAMQPAQVERLRACIVRGWETSHSNRAKTGLFLGGAGLFRRARKEDDEGWLDAGLDHAARHGLKADSALLEAARQRVVPS